MTRSSETGVKSRFVDLDSGQLHIRGVLDSDQSATVLLLHMTALSSAVYESSFVPLSGSVRPIAVDTPGFGGSEKADDAPTIASYAEVIHALVQELDIERPVIAAQHTGTNIAIEYALQYPAEVGGLVLSGVPVVSPDEAAKRLEAKEVVTFQESGEHIAEIWRRSRAQHPKLTVEKATRYLVDELLAGPGSYLDAYTAVYTYPIEAKLRELAGKSVPVLLLYGTDDCIAGMQTRAAELLPDAEVIACDGLTDFLADDDPQQFTRAITDFVAKLDLQPGS